MRGGLDYVVTAPTADAYRLEVEGRESHFKTPVVDLPLMVWLDGELLGRFNLSYGPQANGLVHCFTPFIQAGPHTVRVFWDNVGSYRSLRVEAVRLQAVASPHLAADGMKLWVANRLAAQSGVEVAPASSPVSPVCIEGRGQYLSMMSVAAGRTGMSALQAGGRTGMSALLAPVAVQAGAGNRWFANVPLTPGAPTVVETSFQNGGLTETNVIAWQVTDLLTATDMTVRQGDSLLFTAVPAGATNGEVSLSVTGAGLRTSDALTPIPVRFDEAGAFTVTGAFVPTGASGSITVNVVSASLDSIAARMNHARYWTCTNLPPGVVLDADPRLKLVRVFGKDAETNQAPAEPNKREYRVLTRANEPRCILARLGTNGPVMASAVVEGFRSSGAPETYLRQIAVNPDGSQLIETAFVISPLPAGLSVKINIIVSGVTFEDGTVNRTLSAADFDEVGVCRVRFIRGAGVKSSVCHTFNLFDRGQMISWQ
jgi:hypothetical protein